MGPRVRLKFEVDATKLPDAFKGRFGRIIFNFPHTGGQNNIRRCRMLMDGIFRSIHGILSEGAEFHLALRANQAGLNLSDDLLG
jgi:hypothetical protein